MKVEVVLNNTCLNCEKPIPMDFMLCTTRCMNELRKEAKEQGVDSHYGISDVWRKPQPKS